MKTVRVQKERHYTAHHAFHDIAYTALKNAEMPKNQQRHQPLVCMIFCGLTLEAVANAFGERLVENWDDFENASPIVKLRTIFSTIGVSWNGKQEPFATVIWLVRFRNKVAHAKPESIRTDAMMTDLEFRARQYDPPVSKLESHVSLENAQRAMKQVHALMRLLIDNTPPEKWHGLVADGYTASAKSIS